MSKETGRTKEHVRRFLVLFALALPFGLSDLVPSPEPGTTRDNTAWAVVGRPVTPMSYAGVARRTSRRTARRTSARWAAGTTMTTLPAGCVPTVFYGMTYQHCGSAYYQPYYDGPEVVYVEVEQPEQHAKEQAAQDQQQAQSTSKQAPSG